MNQKRIWGHFCHDRPRGKGNSYIISLVEAVRILKPAEHISYQEDANTRNDKITPLYERLSRGDELQVDSNSIVHQKEMLEEYARKNHFPNYIYFTDDGISGTRFERPGFTAMMEEVEAGREAIIVKDMSRLGCGYLKVGQVMEILRQQGVRLIAINDRVDSDKGDDDFIPFRNIMKDSGC